jgi:hypothetical protein
MHAGFWWGDLNERYNLKELSKDDKIILKLILSTRIGCLSMNTSVSE